MSIGRKSVIRLVGFLFVALVVQACAFYYLNECPCYSEANQNDGRPEKWLCSLLASPEAVISSLVLACNVILFWFITRQIKQAETGLMLTRDSIEVSINGQRGKLVFILPSDIYVFGATKRVHAFHHKFVNVGTGIAIVKEIQYGVDVYEIVNKRDGVDVWPKPYKTFPTRVVAEPFPLGNDEDIDTHFRHDPPSAFGYPFHIPEDAAIAIQNSQGVFIQYKVIYETMFGTYEMLCAWRIGHRTIEMVLDSNYNGDRRIAEQRG